MHLAHELLKYIDCNPKDVLLSGILPMITKWQARPDLTAAWFPTDTAARKDLKKQVLWYIPILTNYTKTLVFNSSVSRNFILCI